MLNRLSHPGAPQNLLDMLVQVVNSFSSLSSNSEPRVGSQRTTVRQQENTGLCFIPWYLGPSEASGGPPPPQEAQPGSPWFHQLDGEMSPVPPPLIFSKGLNREAGGRMKYVDTVKMIIYRIFSVNFTFYFIKTDSKCTYCKIQK